MVKRMIEFCGLEFKNPLIVASSPATETISNVVKCAKAGAGGVILKSMGPKKITKNGVYSPRRVFIKDNTIFIQSSSRREILSVDAGAKLIKEAKKRITIPVIASVCGVYKNLREWNEICKIAKDAGADMLQIDTFYCAGLGNYIDRVMFNNLVSMAEDIQNSNGIPVIIKISPNIHVQVAAETLKKRDIGVSLLDSLPVGIPPDMLSKNYSSFRGIRQHGKCLATGKILFPISLLYTQTLFRSEVGPICAGGGVFNSTDVLNLLISGASLVQIASSVCVNGFKIVSEILSDLNKVNQNIKLEQIRNEFHKFIGDETVAIDGRVFHGRIECGECIDFLCESAVMCGDRDNKCEGCGVCIDICPQGKARFVSLKNDTITKKRSYNNV